MHKAYDIGGLEPATSVDLCVSDFVQNEQLWARLGNSLAARCKRVLVTLQLDKGRGSSQESISSLSGIKSLFPRAESNRFFSGPGFVSALVGIRRLVVQITAIETDDLDWAGHRAGEQGDAHFRRACHLAPPEEARR